MYIILMMLPKKLDKSYKAYLPKYQINSSNYSTLPQDNVLRIFYICMTMFMDYDIAQATKQLSR